MSDLIDRQKALDAIQQRADRVDSVYSAFWEGLIIAQDIVKNVPSAEPERKIIHCKDCKFAHLTTKGEVKYCDVWFPETKTYLSADDFCSSAEKRGKND